MKRAELTAFRFKPRPGQENILELQTLENFLASIERRALRMARVRTGNWDEALDIVQEAMTQLAIRYADKAWEEWRVLFYRILHNKINDYHRRRAVRQKFKGFLPGSGGNDNEHESEEDPIEQVADFIGHAPPEMMEREQQMKALLNALATLPRRQQEAFMMRCWEGLSTAETAQAMGCGEGSVKTHYFRALQSLRHILEEHRP